MLARLRERRTAFLLAAASGCLYFTGFCGLDQWYLAWICLVPVLWALDDDTLTGREALAIAWVFGTVTHLGGYTWIVEMLRKFGYLPLPLAALGYFLLCLGQGSLLAFWGWSVARLRRVGVPLVWSAPVLMVVAEWLYPALFPSYLSNSQYRRITAIQSLDVWGPLGLTFLLVLCSSLLYALLRHYVRLRDRPTRATWAAAGAFAVLLFANLLYGLFAVADIDDTVAHVDRRIKVGIVQANVGIYDKASKPLEGLRKHRDQSLEVELQGAQLIVWPESGFYRPIRDGLSNVRDLVMGPIRTPMLFGGLRTEHPTARGQRSRLFNSAFLIDRDGNVLGTYDKTFLLAFGEYLPLGDTLPFLYDLSPHTSRFDRGTHTEPLTLDGVKYGVLICYEDILPSFVRRVMESEPHVLVNMTNDAWFGDTREPLIHLALATFRAVEQRRFLVRSTNTGISAFVDPAGRILAQTPVFAPANLVAEIVPLDGVTVYARFGDWVGVLCLAVTLLWSRASLRDYARRFGRFLLRRRR